MRTLGMFPRTFLALIFALLGAAPWLAGGAALAQDPVPGVFDEVIDVRVVNLEIVVTDKDNVRVSGLSPEDFILTVDGNEVPIEYFTEVLGGDSVLPGEGAGSTVPALAPGRAVGTSYLLFIDEYFSLATDRNRVIAGMIEQLPLLSPEDRMAVVAFNGGKLEMLSTWSQSVESLTRVLTKARDRPSHGLRRLAERRSFDSTRFFVDGRQPLGGIDQQLGLEERQLAEVIANQVRRVVLGASSALRSFANPSGRKVMMILSGGWPYNPVQWVVDDPARALYGSGIDGGDTLYRPLLEAANRLSYTLYPVDVPGFKTNIVSAEDGSLAEATVLRDALFNREQEEQAALHVLARGTGGKAILNNANRSAFERVVADTRSYYWLGFTPTWKGDDASHKIKVRGRSKGLRVRSRTGFADLSREREVSMMVESALLFGNPPSSTPLLAEVGKAKKSGFGKALVPLKLGIPLDALTFIPQGPDLWVAELELRVAVLDEQGNSSDVPVIPLKLQAPGQPTGGLMKSYETQIKIRRKKHDLVVSIYDRASGKILSKRLEVDPR